MGAKPEDDVSAAEGLAPAREIAAIFDEHNKYRRQHGLLRKPGGQPQPINHGTNGGYHTHRRRGQQPCDACSQAHISYELARREGGDAA